MGALVTLVLVLMPAVAAACPACVGQQDSFNRKLMALGVMILFPFFVSWLVIRAVRKELKK